MGQFLLVSLGLLLVAFSLNGIGADHHCPSDWYSFDKFCYKFIKQWKSWNDAEASCTRLQNSSHLASIHSQAEIFRVQKVIFMNTVLYDDVWIGLSDPWENGTWVWSDGSAYDYTSWVSEKPSAVDEEQHCVHLSSSSRYREWEAATCESNNYFICKM
uniref:C-type lectin 1 n=1 Tax=Micrurus fulvius TaxID=8637 RepID=U3FVH4_MICFL